MDSSCSWVVVVDFSTTCVTTTSSATERSSQSSVFDAEIFETSGPCGPLVRVHHDRPRRQVRCVVLWFANSQDIQPDGKVPSMNGETMAEAITVSGPISGTDKTMSFEAGKLAGLANGAVTARIGDTQILVTATASSKPPVPSTRWSRRRPRCATAATVSTRYRRLRPPSRR